MINTIFQGLFIIFIGSIIICIGIGSILAMAYLCKFYPTVASIMIGLVFTYLVGSIWQDIQKAGL